MKVVIDRQTGNREFSPDRAFVSNDLIAYGQVDRLHTESGTIIWHPTWEMVEGYLASKAPEDIPFCVTNIEGKFLITYQRAGQIFIFCDRYCFARTYYRRTLTSIEIFDQVLGQVAHPEVKQSEALAFLMFRWLIGRRTLFDQIYQLMGGECLVLDLPTGHLHAEVSSVYPQKELPAMNDLEAAQGFHDLFREALDARLQAYSPDETLIIPLSGGFDSRYLLGTALELVSPSRILTFTFGSSGTYDFEYGQQVARKAGVRNIPYALSTKDFGREALIQNCADTDAQIGFSIETPLAFFYRMAEHGRVILSGNPGNGIMGELLRPLAHHERRSMAFEDSILPEDDPLAHYLDEQILEDSFSLLETPEPTRLYGFELWCFTNHIPKYSNQCLYKYPQHFSYISPFLDYAFVDFVLNLPFEMRFNRSLYFYWLERHFPDLASIPCAWFNGVPLTASRLEKFAAHQWDRVLRRILKINRRANKIDLNRYAGELLDTDQLDGFAREIFSPQVRDLIFRASPSRNMLLFGLKSLEILKSNWDVAFYQKEPSVSASQVAD